MGPAVSAPVAAITPLVLKPLVAKISPELEIKALFLIVPLTWMVSLVIKDVPKISPELDKDPVKVSCPLVLRLPALTSPDPEIDPVSFTFVPSQVNLSEPPNTPSLLN